MISAARPSHWWLLAALVIATAVAQQWPHIFQYERQAILNGEYWRLLSCHFVHLDWPHLALNLLALALLCHTFAGLHSPRLWLAALLLCGGAISLALLLLVPKLSWYVGLSGLLHGLFSMAMVAGMRSGKLYFGAGLLLLTGKLLLEQLAPAWTATGAVIEGTVITEAHLAGAIAGLVIALLLPAAKKAPLATTAVLPSLLPTTMQRDCR